MREILFRGKSVNDGNWVQGSLVITTIEPADDAPIKHYHIEDMTIGVFPNEYQSGLSETVDPNTVGQFTGLTDKNGKKIFEGDIIGYHAQGDIIVNFGVVVWDADDARWAYQLNTMKPGFYMHNPKAVEVIGNIHDNPELLEGGAVDGK